jgi:hypothetical protein
MAQVDWASIMNGNSQPKKRYSGANIKFFYAYNENREKSLAEGRPIFDEIPSISIQWPGGDETVRRIEQQDIHEYPELYERFKAGSEPVTEGTPLAEWAMMSGSALRELNYLGFKTVEQLAAATDDVKRKIGPLSKLVTMAKDWLEAANSDQNEVVKLKQQLASEVAKREKLEEKLELFLQRIEANEGTDLRPLRKEMTEEVVEPEIKETPKKRGRPRRE